MHLRPAPLTPQYSVFSADFWAQLSGVEAEGKTLQRQLQVAPRPQFLERRLARVRGPWLICVSLLDGTDLLFCVPLFLSPLGRHSLFVAPGPLCDLPPRSRVQRQTLQLQNFGTTAPLSTTPAAPTPHLHALLSACAWDQKDASLDPAIAMLFP
jgi:hypothetical protein